MIKIIISEICLMQKGDKKGMPLTMAKVGEPVTVQKITGNSETRRYLEHLGFVAGTQIEVVSSIGGNVIVNVKDSRIAVNEDMARHIYI